MVFKLPEEVVVEQWRKVVAHVFDPENLHSRYRHNIVNTYPNRKKVPLGLQEEMLEGIRMFVVPSSSARTAAYQMDAKLRYYRELKQLVDQIAIESKV